jgi:hypothetical protein
MEEKEIFEPEVEEEAATVDPEEAKRSGYAMIRETLVSPYVLGVFIPILITVYILFSGDGSTCSSDSFFSALCYVNLASTISVVWGLYFLTVLMFFIVDLFFDKKNVYKSEKFFKFIILVVCALLVYGTASIFSLWIYFAEQIQRGGM